MEEAGKERLQSCLGAAAQAGFTLRVHNQLLERCTEGSPFRLPKATEID